MVSEARWLDLAETAVRLAEGAGATAAEVLVQAERSALTRFANSSPMPFVKARA